MHPNKFMGVEKKRAVSKISPMEYEEKLGDLGLAIAAKRDEAINARKSSGIESVWLACEEGYLGIDEMNRNEYADAKWAKPTSIQGPLTSNRMPSDDTRSNAFVQLTSRYVDNASAKLCEILLPIDEKAFKFEPTPVPDLVKMSKDLSPIIDEMSGQPQMRQMRPEEAPQAPQQPGMPPMMPTAQGAQQMVQMTVADKAREAMDQAAEMADKAETRVYDWMVESKYPAETRKVVKDAARIGVGILKGPFPDIRRGQALTHVDGAMALQIEEKIAPAVRWISPWDFFPADGCGENIHDADDVLERDFMAERSLKKLKDQPHYLPDQIDKVIEEGPGKMYSEGMNPAEKKKTSRYEIWYYYGMLKREDLELAMCDQEMLEQIPDDQDGIHAIVTLVNETVIRVILNPMDSGSFPYHVMCWSRRAGHWAGVGVAEKMTMPQKMVNAATRALLNNAGLSAGPQIVIDQMAIIPADGSWKLTPNKIWWKSGDSALNVEEAFMSVQIPSVQKEMMEIILYGMKLAEESTGIPLITQGQASESTPETFGAAELQNTNAHTWLRSVAYVFDDQITEPVVKAFYEWLLLDPNVPDDEKGDFHINAHGSIAMVERAIQEQVFLSLLQASANPAFKLDPALTMSEFLKAKRIDSRRVQFSPEKQKQMEDQPPMPPIQIAVEQIRGQNDIALQKAKTESELALAQQAQQSGAVDPAAIARIEQEKIRSQTLIANEQSRAHAEESRADKEMLIAQQNGEYRVRELEIKRELAILEYANQQKIAIDQIKAQLAKTAIDSQTKKELAAAEIQLAANENERDRQVDMQQHSESLVRDEMSTPNTP